MYEFAGSKSAKLVVQRIREISSPDSSVFCLACLCEYPNKSSHISCWFCCLLQSFRKSSDLCFDYRKRDEHIDRNRERTDPEEIELEQLFGYIFTIY